MGEKEGGRRKLVNPLITVLFMTLSFQNLLWKTTGKRKPDSVSFNLRVVFIDRRFSILKMDAPELKFQ